MHQRSPNDSVSYDPRGEFLQAREELGRALETAFERWGAWHGAPSHRKGAVKLEIARAEAELARAQKRFEDAQRRSRRTT